MSELHVANDLQHPRRRATTRTDFSTASRSRSQTHSSTKSAAAEAEPKADTLDVPTTPIRTKLPYGSFVDLFSLSPIPEAESFSLKMPATPFLSRRAQSHEQQQHVSPMEIDSTTPSRTTTFRTHQQHQQQPHNQHNQHNQHNHTHHDRDVKRPLVSVFDWDDTLCPSSWLYHQGLLAQHDMAPEPLDLRAGLQRTNQSTATAPEVARKRLARFEDHVIALLQRALAMGPVYIITAATLLWVEDCAAHFLPRVQLFLVRHDVRVVSAREWYQQTTQCKGSASAWKAATFNALCAHLQLEQVSRRAQRRVDFVSIGDAVFERDACRQIERQAPAVVHAKTLKFVDRPSLQELLDQVALTTTIYPRIRSHSGSLDLLIHRNAHRKKGDPTLKLVEVDVPKPAHASEMSIAERVRALPSYVAMRSRGTDGISSSIRV